MRTFLFFIGFMLIALCGCTHTVVGGGGDSPAKRYSLWVESHGASGKAYVDKTKKDLRVSIESRDGTNPVVLFEQRYVLTGSDIQWDTRWSSEESVSVVFYDWGDGVSNYRNMEHLPASNHIASLSFALDRSTGKFIEKK